MPTFVFWERPTASRLEEVAAVPVAPNLRQLVDMICTEAGLTRADLAAILGRDRRNIASWISGRQDPRRETLRTIHQLEDFVKRLNQVRAGLAGAVLSSLYGHPYRGRIVELLRAGDLAEAQRVALSRATDLDYQGQETTHVTLTEYAAGVHDRLTSEQARTSAGESPDTADAVTRMQRSIQSRRRRSAANSVSPS